MSSNKTNKDGYEPIPDVPKDEPEAPEAYPTEFSSDQVDLLSTLDTAIGSGNALSVDSLVPSSLSSPEDLAAQGKEYVKSLVTPTITAASSAAVAVALGLITKATAAEGSVNSFLSSILVYYPYLNAIVVGVSALLPMKERILSSIESVYKTIDDGQQYMDTKVDGIKTTTDTVIDSIQVKLGKVMEPIEPTLEKASVHEKTIQQMVGDDSLNVIPDRKDIDNEIDEAQGLIGDKIVTAKEQLPKLNDYIPPILRSKESLYGNIILPIMIGSVLVQVLFAYITQKALAPPPTVQVHIDTEPFTSSVSGANATVHSYLRGSSRRRRRKLLVGPFFVNDETTITTQLFNFKNPLAGTNLSIPSTNDINHLYTSLSDTVRNRTSDIHVGNLLNGTSDWTSNILNQTSDFTSAITNATSGFTHTILDKANDVTSIAANKTSTLISEATNQVSDATSQAVQQATQVYRNYNTTALSSELSDKFHNVVDAVQNNVTSAYDTIESAFSDKTDSVRDTLSNQSADIKDNLQNAVSDKVDSVRDQLFNQSADIKDDIQNTLSDKADDIRNQLLNQSSDIKDELVKKKEAASDYINNNVQEWKSQANSTIAEYQGKLTDYQNKLSDLTSNLNSTVTGYENQFSDLQNGFNDTIRGYQEKLPDQVAAVKEQVKATILSVVVSYIISLLQLGLAFLLTSPKVKEWVIKKSISAATDEVSRSLRSSGVMETYEDIMVVRMGRIRSKILKMIQFYHKVESILSKMEGLENLSSQLHNVENITGVNLDSVTDQVDNVMDKAGSMFGRFGKK